MLLWARTGTGASTTVQNGASNIQLNEIAVQKEVVVFGDDRLAEAESSKFTDSKRASMSV